MRVKDTEPTTLEYKILVIGTAVLIVITLWETIKQLNINLQ